MYKLNRIQFKIIEHKLNKHNWKQIATRDMFKRLPLPEDHIAYAHPTYYPYRNIIIVKTKNKTEFFLPRNLNWEKLIAIIELGVYPPKNQSF